MATKRPFKLLTYSNRFVGRFSTVENALHKLFSTYALRRELFVNETGFKIQSGDTICLIIEKGYSHHPVTGRHGPNISIFQGEAWLFHKDNLNGTTPRG